MQKLAVAIAEGAPTVGGGGAGEEAEKARLGTVSGISQRLGDYARYSPRTDPYVEESCWWNGLQTRISLL